MKLIKERVRQWRVPIALALFVFLLFNNIFFIGYVPTESMEPTLKTGSFVIGSRIARDFEKGDIIIFFRNGQLLVKRITACPGDEIDLRELDYMNTVATPVREEPVVRIPENCYFVLGDNSENSIDSRYWEDPFVGEENIVAKVILF